MQTTNTRLLDILGADNMRFVIPAYQRLYSWKERQCRELWLDVQRAARADRSHFIGTLLYSYEGEDAAGTKLLAVIDGQQRLTTLTILTIALTRYMRQNNIMVGGMDAPMIESRYLLAGPPCSPSGKLVLSRKDRDTLLAITEHSDLPEEPSPRVMENLAYFEGMMAEEGFDPEALWDGMSRLFVIRAEVGGDDNAQLIFESLNSKGMPLTTADLVRNYLLLAETHDEQARLYDEYWAPIEGMFVPDPLSVRLDNAIQGWLSVRFRKVRAKGAHEVYSVFKQYVEDEYDGPTEALLHELRSFSLVWAENYRYHAVKKYKTAFQWASIGSSSLVANRPKKAIENKEFADNWRKNMDDLDQKR